MPQPQCLNTEINVFLNIRSQRAYRRHESVGSLIYRLRPLVMSVVGLEMATVVVLTRDPNTKDFSVYARDGQPIVMGQYGDLPFSIAQELIPDVDFAFQIGSDKFLTNTLAGQLTDLQANERAVATNNRIVGAPT